MKTEPLIKAHNLSLSFPSLSGKIEILKSVNFSLYTNEKVALVGPSGSGKSSLLMLLGGLEQCTSGSIVIAQKEITHFSEDELADFRKKNIGIIFQGFHLIPTMTAIENVFNLIAPFIAFINSSQKNFPRMFNISLILLFVAPVIS